MKYENHCNRAFNGNLHTQIWAQIYSTSTNLEWLRTTPPPFWTMSQRKMQSLEGCPQAYPVGKGEGHVGLWSGIRQTRALLK